MPADLAPAGELVDVRVLPMGDGALIAEVADIGEVLPLEAAVRAAIHEAAGGDDTSVWRTVDDVVPAARTVLVRTAAPNRLEELARALARLPVRVGGPHGPASGSAAGELVDIPVVYDGPDLDEVARLTGLSVDEVVAAHTGSAWQVAFGGFAPGFAYLVGGDPRLHVPRRSEPRTRVPAGAVALAGEFSGVYPRESPGGWQLLGRTDVELWDVERDPPALLRPGVTVRFVPARGGRTPAASTDAVGATTRSPGRPERALEVLATGPLALVEDLGRPGHMAVGVGRAGAVDVAAHRLGARLVGNDEGLASVEVTLGGLRVRSVGDHTVALTGAPAGATVDERPVPHAGPFPLRDGQVLSVGMPLSGLRTYVAVRGGLAAHAVLGSRSTDTMSGVGPGVLAEGDVLPVGPAPERFPDVDVAPVAPPEEGLVELRVRRGPRADWFTSLTELTGEDWAVSAQSDRVGIRLEGKAIQRTPEFEGAELPSEGMVRGSIQVPPNGQPVLFLNDHPVTGGYPVIGVVRDADVDRAGQLRPGQHIRFVREDT